MRAAPSPAPTVSGRPAPWRRRLARHRGIVVAVLAGLLVWSLTAALRPAPPELVPVLVAARDLAPGTTVLSSDLATVALPAAARPADAPGSADELVGRQVVVPLLAGDAVLRRHLLTSDLLQGYGPDVVASPLRLADSSALAVLRPGDLVDVIAATSGAATTSNASEAVVVARGVRVLLTSATASASSGGGLLAAPSGGDASSLVLATTSAEALAIARAAVGSRLSVVLRSS